MPGRYRVSYPPIAKNFFLSKAPKPACRVQEIASRFHVTRERIRQIEAKTLRRLQHPRRSRGLEDFIENPETPKADVKF